MSLRRVEVADLFSLSSRVITDEGFLIAPAAIARTGVQEYRARELGLDGDPERVVRLHRPAEEVFSPASLASFNHKPVTDGHPPESVTADNWKKFGIGAVHDVRADGDVMRAEMVVWNKATVAAVVAGKAQLSNGYSFELDLTPGKTADGLEYEGIQRVIRGNHNAIVDKARGGPAMRIADGNQQGDSMAIKKIIDGITLEFADDTQASVIEKVVGDAKAVAKTAVDATVVATTRATTAETRATAADAALVEEKGKGLKLVADHATAIAKLTTDHATALAAVQALVLKPEQIEVIAAERSKTIADALVLVPDLKVAGKTVPAIRSEVLAAVMAKDGADKNVILAQLGGIELPKATDVLAHVIFDGIVARAAQSGGSSTTAGGSSVNDAAVARVLAGAGGGAPAIGGRNLMIARMKNAGMPLASEKTAAAAK